MKEKLVEVYDFREEDMYWLDSNEDYFITDDTDLASELIRVLDLDFIHDFKTGAFIFDIYARHELILSYLYEGINRKFASDIDDTAEQYVLDGYGCYHSTQDDWIMLGEDVALPKYLSQFKSKVRYL